MKTYDIQKFDGNINKWTDTFTITGQTNIEPEQAEDFNNHFETTGIKYVEAEKRDEDNATAIQDDTNKVVNDGQAKSDVATDGDLASKE